MVQSPFVATLSSSNVPSGGLRLRRQPSIASEQVGSLQKFNHPYKFVGIQGDFAKIAPSEYAGLASTLHFKPHNPDTEGWCLCRDSDGPLLVIQADEKVTLVIAAYMAIWL